MTNSRSETSERKKEHIEICLNEDVGFNLKTNGFDKYDFLHCALPEVRLDEIDLKTEFFGRNLDLPFLISCMTGGTSEAESINSELAEAAAELNIPIGVGSQRPALEESPLADSFKVIRKYADKVPVLGNIGGAQLAKAKDPVSLIERCVSMIRADAMVIHLNPAQELFQREGEPDFKGFLKKFEFSAGKAEVPLIVKEVGSGISREIARKLLEAGARGIDVAGAGGTSWTAVEIIRGDKSDETTDFFRNWGIPTSYAIRKVNELSDRFDFVLIGSGGISNGVDTAKALALGADLTAAAGPILRAHSIGGIEGVISHIRHNFEIVKKIMYLTDSGNLPELDKSKLIKVNEFH